MSKQKLSATQLKIGESLNMKSASNAGSITPTNSDQDLGSSGLSLSFTVSESCKALVNVNIGCSSTSDFEFRPEIRLGGTSQATFSPSAAAGNSNGRAIYRGFSSVITLSAGANTISAGLFLSSSTSPSIAAGGAFISAIVLGDVTA